MDEVKVEQEVDAVARAMYDSWPHSVISPALAEKTGLPEGTVLTYDKVVETGGNHAGLIRLARAAVDYFAAHRAQARAEALETLNPHLQILDLAARNVECARMRGSTEYLYGGEHNDIRRAITAIRSLSDEGGKNGPTTV
jgi:hypothetical protein